jgi:VanZ family protein
MTEGSFEPLSSRGDSPCSIEIRLQPERSDSSGTLLAFYRPASQAIPFALRQSLGDLVLVRNGQKPLDKRNRVYIDEVFSSAKPVFITITSSDTGTAIYLDGVLTKKVTSFKFSSSDLTGRLVVANAPNTNNSWSGQLDKLAIYNRELSPAEVLQNFHEKAEELMNKTALDIGDNDLVADYRFNEGQGSVIRSVVNSAPSLQIPERFFVIHQPFLERPWDEFRPDWNYWQDVAVNIFGFIPFGFFFRAYFFLIRKIRRATWLTIAFGFATSLTIEVSQAFMPTRDSGMTDLINNTLGTTLGALLCASIINSIMKRDWFSRADVTTA